MLEGALQLGKVRSSNLKPQTSGKRFGDYELLDEIARGGMGVVYRARQISLDRVVAVKLILFGPYADETSVRRFNAEAAAAARLQHPNIVAIHEVGEEAGQHFFSMDCVEGRNLADDARERPRTARQSARLLQTIAKAIHYAHGQGIVHRDLKPSNILIDADDEPRITDFGLAKRLVGMRATASHSISEKNTDIVEPVPTDDLSLTLTGQVLGSPSYVPPEQAAGKRGPVGPRADIYALGAILYYLLTGRPPFAAETITDTLRQVMDGEPVSPRLLNPSLPKDLETICLKCLEKEPARRYASAQDLADELGCFLRDEPIRARPVSSPERLWRWCRRYPAVAVLSGAVLVLLVALAAGSLLAALRINAAREAAVRERDRSERTVVQLELQRAEKLFQSGQAAPALRYLADLLRRQPTNHVVATWVTLALSQRQFPRAIGRPLTHQGTVRKAVFSPDGRVVATASLDGTASVWDAATGEHLAILPCGKMNVEDIDFSPDGERLLTEVENGLQFWRWRDQAPERRFPITEVLSAAFSRDGRHIAAAAHPSVAFVWDASNGALLAGPMRHRGAIASVQFSPDGNQIVTACDDGTAQVRSVATGHAIGGPLRHGAEVSMAVFSPDGKSIVTASRDNTARLWEAATGRALTAALRHTDWVEFVEFSPDGRLVATACRDGSARIWDARTGQQVNDPLRHQSAVATVRFSHDGRHLVTASFDRTARVWNAVTGSPVGEAVKHRGRVAYAEFSPDGRTIVTASDDRTGQLWDMTEALRGSAQRTHTVVISTVAFSPDGTRVVSASLDGTAQLWDAQTGRPMGEPMRHKDYVYAAEFSRDGRHVLTASRDGTGRLWDSQTGAHVQPVFEFTSPLERATFTPDGRRIIGNTRDGRLWLWEENAVLPFPGSGALVQTEAAMLMGLAVSADGTRLVSAGRDGTARLWNVDQRVAEGEPIQHDAVVHSVAFSPNGARLATGCRDHTASLWDVRSRRRLCEPLQHNGEVRFVKFSPDGTRLVTCSRDQTARIWDAFTGRPVTGPLQHDGAVSEAAFDPTGRRLVTSSMDGWIRLWDAHSGQLLSAPTDGGAGIGCVAFSPDGSRVAAGTRDGAILMVETPQLPSPVPDWLPRLAEALAGQRVNAQGTFDFLPAIELEQFRQLIFDLPAGDPYARWAKRFFTR
jgi:WD40 repeat protein/serine/threonine protein kinase